MVHPLVAAALRNKSGMQRLRLAHETWELTRDRLAAFLSRRYPEWSPRQVQAEVAKRLLRDQIWEALLRRSGRAGAE